MSTDHALAAAVPVADVSPELLRRVAWVRAFDPAHPGVATWLPVGKQAGHPGLSSDRLNVMIDGGRRGEQLELLRVMILLAAAE
jgi:hypothetical protein